ncbi:hypothetical protein DENSPDRAFT_833386 [Dentipellis sp. KUC8613]|nr:hypothetical protein DENSPDRAFT_833386 [Dentipellis sp. KUC8613]
MPRRVSTSATKPRSRRPSAKGRGRPRAISLPPPRGPRYVMDCVFIERSKNTGRQTTRGRENGALAGSSGTSTGPETLDSSANQPISSPPTSAPAPAQVPPTVPSSPELEPEPEPESQSEPVPPRSMTVTPPSDLNPAPSSEQEQATIIEPPPTAGPSNTTRQRSASDLPLLDLTLEPIPPRPRAMLRVPVPPLFPPLSHKLSYSLDAQLAIRAKPKGFGVLSSPVAFYEADAASQFVSASETPSGSISRTESTSEDAATRREMAIRFSEPVSAPLMSRPNRDKGKGRADPPFRLRSPSTRVRIPTAKVVESAYVAISEPGPSRRPAKRRRTEPVSATQVKPSDGGRQQVTGRDNDKENDTGDGTGGYDFQMMDMSEVASLPWVPTDRSERDRDPESSDPSLYVPPGVRSLIDNMKHALEIESRARCRAEARYTEEMKRRVAAEELLEAERTEWQNRSNIIIKLPAPQSAGPSTVPASTSSGDAAGREASPLIAPIVASPPPPSIPEDPEEQLDGDIVMDAEPALNESPKTPFANQFWPASESLNRLLPMSTTSGAEGSKH